MHENSLKDYYFFWLHSCLALITIMVILGGYTRLTDSGLSITEWQLISGILPPLNQGAWQEMFLKYQQIPQYSLKFPDIDLAGFKNIFWLEYIHRVFGRILGLVILLPALFFYCQKSLSKSYKKFALLITILVVLQGTMGWIMVASGLTENTSVSHYRLAIHLLIAFIIFAAIAAFIYAKKRQNKTIYIISNYKSFKKLFYIFTGLLILQIIYGAYVAGLDAGLIYNNYPMMGEKIYPKELIVDFAFYKIFADPAIVQFIHRGLALLLLINLAFLWLVIIENKRHILFCLLLTLSILLTIQFALGVLTLVSKVNIHLAVLHQLTALFLFACNALIFQETKICNAELSS